MKGGSIIGRGVLMGGHNAIRNMIEMAGTYLGPHDIFAILVEEVATCIIPVEFAKQIIYLHDLDGNPLGTDFMDKTFETNRTRLPDGHEYYLLSVTVLNVLSALVHVERPTIAEADRPGILIGKIMGEGNFIENIPEN